MSNNTHYRVGLVGTGGIARAHGKACQLAESAELAAICDVSESALTNFGEQFEVNARQPVSLFRRDVTTLRIWTSLSSVPGARFTLRRVSRLQNPAKSRRFCVKNRSRQQQQRAEAFVGAAQENGVLVAEAFKVPPPSDAP